MIKPIPRVHEVEINTSLESNLQPQLTSSPLSEREQQTRSKYDIDTHNTAVVPAYEVLDSTRQEQEPHMVPQSSQIDNDTRFPSPPIDEAMLAYNQTQLAPWSNNTMSFVIEVGQADATYPDLEYTDGDPGVTDGGYIQEFASEPETAYDHDSESYGNRYVANDAEEFVSGTHQSYHQEQNMTNTGEYDEEPPEPIISMYYEPVESHSQREFAEEDGGAASRDYPNEVIDAYTPAPNHELAQDEQYDYEQHRYGASPYDAVDDPDGVVEA